MSRIATTFTRLKRNGQKGFIPFITAGDPDVDASLAIALRLADLGADIIELGVPFSDPMADGPTIQRSSQRSLAGGTTLNDVIELMRRIRLKSDVAIVLFSYLNPLLRPGIEEFAEAAAEAGADGVLITDAVGGEAAKIGEILATNEIDMISLVAPTTTDERLEQICSHARGFVYAVSRAGVTGARDAMSDEAEKLVTRARRFTSLPIAVGFGISTREQVEDVWRYGDAAVVGSAIVAEIERTPDAAVAAVDRFVRSMLPRFANAEVGT